METEFFAADPLWDPFGNPSFDRGLTAVAVAVHSPLETGSERYYQFRSADTVTVRLEGGRTVEAGDSAFAADSSDISPGLFDRPGKT